MERHDGGGGDGKIYAVNTSYDSRGASSKIPAINDNEK